MRAALNFMSSILHSLDRLFRLSHADSMKLLESVAPEILYERSSGIGQKPYALSSVGECLIRSGAAVEQVIGGITTRLWDDPFEWTLPEQLNSVVRIAEYLSEVEIKRLDGFEYLSGDDDLSKTIPAPENMRTIFELLSDALVKSSHYRGRAFALCNVLSGRNLPGI